MKNATMTIYACGGAGVNIVKKFEKHRKDPSSTPHEDDEVFARTVPIYIDTSRSNMTAEIPADFTYILEGLDGSGKVRKENAEVITECTLDILHRHKPGDISVVVSSTSGGSGSVLAPSIVSELLDRGHNVIVCAVGSDDSRIELENTAKTLKSYEAISKMRKTPVIMIYRSNSEAEGGRGEVDAEMYQEIVKLAALFSRRNRELDTKDLHNWLHYSGVTSFQPKLSLLEFYHGKIDDLKAGQVISVATLCLDNSSSTTGLPVEYQCVGYVDDQRNQRMQIKASMHYAILDGVVAEIHKDLTGKLNQLDEYQRARITKQSILSKDDVPTSNGLIL